MTPEQAEREFRCAVLREYRTLISQRAVEKVFPGFNTHEAKRAVAKRWRAKHG